MPDRISPTTFYIASAVLFALAILAAIARSITRWQRFRRFCIDDGFLFLAVATLVAGTILLYIKLPLAWQQGLITFGETSPPSDVLQLTTEDERVQFASTTLIGTSIICVKFSFLTFFYWLIRLTKRSYRWWWRFVVIVTIGSSPVLMFSNFISCPYTGADILTRCTTPAALARENAAVRASVVLDIISDVLIISIPVLILWNTCMALREKLVLSGGLCMGIFMIVCACVRIGSANVDGDHIDVLWVLFWQQIEASVAVIVVSMTSFRKLFQASGLTKSLTGGPSNGMPTRRDRYECEGWSHSSQWGGHRDAFRKESHDTVDVVGVQRDSGPSVDSHEMALVDK